VEQQLLEELQAVLGDRAPTYDDLEHLPYLQVRQLLLFQTVGQARGGLEVGPVGQKLGRRVGRRGLPQH
jgi:hypothetical protein